MLSNNGRTCGRFDFCGELFLTITQPPLRFRCYRQQKSAVKLFMVKNERRETTEAFPRRSSYTRLVFIGVTQASLPRGVFESILRAFVVSSRRFF